MTTKTMEQDWKQHKNDPERGRWSATIPDRVGQYVLADYLGKKSRVLE
jgi:hypothetical protein